MNVQNNFIYCTNKDEIQDPIQFDESQASTLLVFMGSYAYRHEAN